MKKTIHIPLPIVDWSYYSKSTVAIAKDQPVLNDQNKWHEFVLIPHYNTVSFGFWTLLGCCSTHHSQMEINEKYVPWFDGNPFNSLVIRPDIEEAIRKQFRLTTPAFKWSEKKVYDINFWLRYKVLKQY